MKTELPSKQKYIHDNLMYINSITNIGEYSEPKYKCPCCGGNMRKRLDIILTSLPPKFQYECDTCDNVEYLNF